MALRQALRYNEYTSASATKKNRVRHASGWSPPTLLGTSNHMLRPPCSWGTFTLIVDCQFVTACYSLYQT